MSKSLFNDFESVSSKAWKQKIQTDLKGADYNDTLITKTFEGIDIKPFYHADEMPERTLSSLSSSNTWHICQTIVANEAETANSEALDAINRGAESVQFVLSDPLDVQILLRDLPSSIPVHFQLGFFDPNFQRTALDNHGGQSLHFDTDIIGHLAEEGNWYSNLKEDHTALETLLNQAKDGEQLLQIRSDIYQNAGANAVQQLAYTLAHLNEYLNHFDKLQNNISVRFAVGTNYFMEIAKLKAFRLLWEALASEYDHGLEQPHVFVTPTRRNKTLYDYNTNMLRTTTECMSAVLGGANTISNAAYDAIFHNANEFGERISRNQLLILKSESYFDKVANPTDGAYYIESLTEQLAEKALELFKDIEANGGFLHQLKEGIIQRKIKESAQKEQASFDEGRTILLGTNKHPNPKDQMAHDLEKEAFAIKRPRKTLIAPITSKRLAEALEQERLKSES